MKINFIKKTFLLFALSLAIISCDEYNDQTGHSKQMPTNPTLSINFDFGNPTLLVENDQELDFTVSISTSNVVDTKVYVTQVGGDADDHDYSVTGLLVIPAGYTSATGTIIINHDEIIEDTESLVLQVADNRTANTTYSSATAQISILNVTSGDLEIHMEWEASEPTYDSSGEEIDPRDLADLRLLVTDMDLNIVGGADGGSFETYVFSGEQPDGDYLVVADFYAAMDDPIRLLNLTSEFNQTGLIEHDGYEFDDALSTEFICPENYYILNQFTKTGDNYNIVAVGEGNSVDVAGEWTLEMTDLYGDGWNGGYLNVTIDGDSTEYRALPGTAGTATTTTETFTVEEGSILVIEYVSGGGTGQDPGWEEENIYTITGPGGNSITDGPIPTEGIVVDSNNVCI